MVATSSSNQWRSAEAFRRLGRAASRLGAEVVVDADAGRPARELRLDRVLALHDTGLLSPTAEEGQFLLLAAIDEAVKGKVLLAAVDNVSNLDAERLDSWHEEQVRVAEDELARQWGEPVAELIQRRRADPELEVRLAAGFEEAMECLDANT